MRLFFGVLRLRRYLEPIRTRSLMLSKMPKPVQRFLTRSPLSQALFFIGQERFSEARAVIDGPRLSVDHHEIAQGAYLIAVGELSKALETLEPDLTVDGGSRSAHRPRSLRNRLIDSATSELRYLNEAASNKRLEPLARGPLASDVLKEMPLAQVLHVLGTSLPYTHAGYTMRTQFLLRALANQGVPNVGVTRYLYPVDRAVLRANESDCVDSVTYLRELPTKAPTTRDLFHRGWAKALIEIARTSKARLLQPTTDFPNGRAALAASAALNLPVVYEVRGFLEESAQTRRSTAGAAITDRDERYDLVRQAETNVMMAATAVTTLSETMKSEIVQRGVDERRIHVMPNGVSAELLTMRTDTSSLRAKLGIKDKELVVGVVTTFAAHEGLPTLVSAVELLKSKNLPVKCVMVGSGPTWHATKKLISDQGLGDSIHLPGRVRPDEVAQWYQLLDLFVLPRVDSRVTQLVTPLKPLEAMALGVPVVGSDVAGVSEVVVNGVTGALFEPENPAACALKIEELLYDSSTRDELADAGRAWVAQQRTWAMIAKRYVSLYQELGAV